MFPVVIHESLERRRNIPLVARPRFAAFAPGAMASRTFWVGTALVFAGVALRQLIFHFVYQMYIDDSYVFMRYADNLAAGRGPAFNPGEFVMGFTSPLFTYLTAALKFAMPFVATPTILGLLNVALFVALSFGLLRLAGSQCGAWWGLLALWFFYSPFVDGSLNGMETMLFVALQFATVGLFARGDRNGWNFGIVAAALVALTRPEGVLFCALALLYVAWRRPRPRPWLGAVILVVLGSSWALYAMSTFGHVIPQSVVAKALSSGAGGQAERISPLQMLPVLAFGLSSGLFIELGPRVGWILVGLGFVALGVFAVGARALLHQRTPAVILAGFFAINWVAYAIGNPVRLWSWYTVPTAFAFWYCCFAGLARLTEGRRILQFLVLTGVVAVSTASLVLGIRSRIVTRKSYSMPLREIARSIVDDYPKTESIMLGDIGIIGYYTKARIIDLAGLVSRTPLRRGPSGDLLSYGELIAAERPDILIMTHDLLTADSRQEARVSRQTFVRSEDRADFERDYEDRSARYLPFRHLYVRRAILDSSR